MEAAVADYAGDHRADTPRKADESDQETDDRPKLLPPTMDAVDGSDPQERPNHERVCKRDGDGHIPNRPANPAFRLGRDEPGKTDGGNCHQAESDRGYSPAVRAAAADSRRRLSKSPVEKNCHCAEHRERDRDVQLRRE